MGHPKFRQGTLAGSILLLLAGPAVHASGFSIPEISVAGTALSNAVVANPEVYGAVAYNPALAVFHSGTQISAGVNLIRADSKVTPQSGSANHFQGRDNVFVPNLQITHQLSDSVSLGFGTTVPLGLSTNFPVGTFASLPPLLQPTESKVEIIDFSPTAAIRIGNNSAIGFGLDYYWAREIVFDTAAISNSGKGHGWGWNISAYHGIGKWSFGASFHSRSQIDITGTSTFPAPIGTRAATAKLIMPWRAQIGVRYQVNQKLALEADISRIGWNSFNKLVINNSVSPVVSDNQWKDANAYRLSGTYQLDEHNQLRFGYSRDMTGSGDAHFSARTADANRNLFSIGLGHQFSKSLEINLSYMLVRFDKRDYNSNAPFGAYGTDPNGTKAYNGTYKTTVNIFGIGVRKAF